MWLISATIITLGLMIDGHLSRIDALILLLALAANIAMQIIYAKRHAAAASESTILASDEHAYELAEDELPDPNTVSTPKSLAKLIIGLIVLVLSSRLIAWGAVELAKLWGLSDLINLTIVAIGTSLPELVSSVIAARRGEFEMALGNVLGSNLFNTLRVVGVAAIIMPMQVEPAMLSRDAVVMSGVTLLLFALCALALKRDGQIGRGVGLMFISCFIGYSAWLAMSVMA
ncbi:Inner membrane protein YrbG, predicted calcium/sodium:proton antiporter [Moraxella catarrhalis]|uniref:Inner membrane protein YrbG, predicted calcium/sodium:proton antiporter n=1 Tax=Moraxella catarrhalis TaxID=480 RepID=A0A198UP14_MORCA|nr:hypothetical protein [Moraxella catarrhalis]OAU95947.1 Inner membrane protein YrbG, predicted calcium/sodium:proton antiporter [Moraxella catarrhalis]OAU98019.1 Inner membrane protein YrbG, predicted calcium/sodium:proton antiporter [Moraxella catarrhalis]OAU98891.1 Inner membrane protein YrbG, predicted calcium/sodium:proton antiporter [Moraxella catarrhalis]